MNMKSILSSFVLVCLVSCGGGGPVSGVGSNGSQSATTYPLLATPEGTACSGIEADDVFGSMRFETAHPINAKPWGCLLVNASQKQPVFDGRQSARFEVRPDDCSGNSGFNDCVNDRSRHEINESGISPTQGQLITWEERIFIPAHPRFRPQGRNAMFITQINYVDSVNYGTLAFIEVAQDGALMIRTHLGMTFNIFKQYLAHPNPVDQWVKFKFEVKSTAMPDGYLKVYVNDQLIVDETRQTLPTPSSSNWLKIGIYNSFKSQATEAYETQVVYYDGLVKTVRPF